MFLYQFQVHRQFNNLLIPSVTMNFRRIQAIVPKWYDQLESIHSIMDYSVVQAIVVDRVADITFFGKMPVGTIACENFSHRSRVLFLLIGIRALAEPKYTQTIKTLSET